MAGRWLSKPICFIMCSSPWKPVVFKVEFWISFNQVSFLNLCLNPLHGTLFRHVYIRAMPECFILAGLSQVFSEGIPQKCPHDSSRVISYFRICLCESYYFYASMFLRIVSTTWSSWDCCILQKVSFPGTVPAVSTIDKLHLMWLKPRDFFSSEQRRYSDICHRQQHWLSCSPGSLCQL